MLAGDDYYYSFRNPSSIGKVYWDVETSLKQSTKKTIWHLGAWPLKGTGNVKGDMKIQIITYITASMNRSKKQSIVSCMYLEINRPKWVSTDGQCFQKIFRQRSLIEQAHFCNYLTAPIHHLTYKYSSIIIRKYSIHISSGLIKHGIDLSWRQKSKSFNILILQFTMDSNL